MSKRTSSAKDHNVLHGTIVIRRTINAPADSVFAAWESPGARSLWGPPTPDEAITFVQNDFRVGGTDVHLCGPREDLRYRVETRYLDIRRPDRLLFSEHTSLENSLLGVSLVTVVLADAGPSTDLELTVQIASMSGEEMIAGTEHGWQTALVNLDRHVSIDGARHPRAMR